MTETAPPDSETTASGAPYQVLARKYRPDTFAGLIGQDAMVRTLTNAIRSDRLAQAFILTGVRGVGKTSTARIIARSLNCVGTDGGGDPTSDPCGVCEHCRAIAEDRHVDVLEMDAASRTGVDDIREIIDGVRYRPTTARFKIYIIDEVHMLSKHAFNALLKTLEEPPEHVKFVFATTEVRKVPVTVLSRCQRFDLRRVDMETLTKHFRDITEKEGARVSEAALHLISRAADGSVRDGLSLLDQAISHSARGEGGEIDDAEVREMLGLADRSQSFQLLEAVLAGDVAPALKLLDQLYREGADPLAVLEDLLEITHWLTRIKVVPDTADAPQVPEIERVRGKDLEGRLSMAALARAWQMLLKGLAEARQAPSPIQAAEMILVRMAYIAELPTPADAIRELDRGSEQGPEKNPAGGEGEKPLKSPPRKATEAESGTPPPEAQLTGTGDAPVVPPPASEAAPETVPGAMDRPDPVTLERIAALAADTGRDRLHRFLTGDVRLTRFEPGRIEFNTRAGASGDMVEALREFLNRATARPWTVTVSNEAGAPTLEQQQRQQGGARDLKAEAAGHPLVKAVLETFPGATIEEIRPAPEPETGQGLRPESGEDALDKSGEDSGGG
ncbi:MAG: DNA polymerase III subunit gamma/tau [Rhodospirillaceae bacterium]|jgi:DNA polymerase-3 subunit gamma/tau|nr:DNA polymerase III subunit gamma/tau [Rhodospirillaceae bacterium]